VLQILKHHTVQENYRVPGASQSNNYYEYGVTNRSSINRPTVWSIVSTVSSNRVYVSPAVLIIPANALSSSDCEKLARKLLFDDKR